MNVAIYARVSTELQAEHGYSIGTQIESCRKKASNLGATVIKEYVDDGYSGGFLERPALDQLRDAVADGLYDGVIIHDADRLSRKLMHQLLLVEEFEKYHCRPIFVLGEVANTPEGAMTLQMKGVFAEYERSKIRERTMRGKRAKLRSGKSICDSHIYGYDFDKDSSTYNVNPAEAEIVRKIYKWYVGDKIGSCEIIAQKLNEAGIPSPSGRGSWHVATVRNILHRPHYTGRYYANAVYHKKTGPNSYARIPRPQDEWIEMTCPQIIDEELHQQALAIKSTKRTFKSWKPAQNPGLLQGLAYCGKCGGRIYITCNSQQNKKYYMCNFVSPRKGKKCDTRYMSVPLTDNIFWEALKDACRSEQKLLDYINRKKPADSAPPQQKQRRDLTKRLSKIADERKVIMSWFSSSLLTQEEATEKLGVLKAEESRIKDDLASMDMEKPQVEKMTPADICSIINNCEDTPEARRKAILTVIEKVMMRRLDDNYGPQYIIDFDIYFK